MEKAKSSTKVDLVEQARQLRLQAEDLEKKVLAARGTARIRKPTVPARPNVIVRPAHGPYWTGDEGTTHELMLTIQRMLIERPYTFQQIIEATGARDNRIKGAITGLQRAGVRVVDVAPEGTRRANWFIPSDAVMQRIARARRASERLK